MTSPMYPGYDPTAQPVTYGYGTPNPAVEFNTYGAYAAYPFAQHMYPQWNAAGVGAVGVGVQGLGYHTQQHPPQNRPRNNGGGRGGKPRLGGRDGRGSGQTGRHNVGSPQTRTMSNPKTEITPSAGAASMTSELEGWSHAVPSKRAIVASSINLIQEETTIRINMNENTGVVALTGSPGECGKVMERIVTIWSQLHNDVAGVRTVQNTRPQQQQQHQHQHQQQQQQQQDRRPQRPHYQQNHNGANRAIGGHTNGFASQQQLARDTRDLGHHSAHTHGPQDPTLHHALHQQQHIQQAQSPFGIPGLLPTMPMDAHHSNNSYLQQQRAREQQQQQQQQNLISAMPQHAFANSLGHNLGGVSTWGQQPPLKQTFSAPGPQPQPVPQQLPQQLPQVSQQLPQPVAQPVQQPQPIPQSQSPIVYGQQSHVVGHTHPTVFDAPQPQPQPQVQTHVQQAHHTAHPTSPVDMGLGLGYRLTQPHQAVQASSPVSAPAPAAVSPLATPTPVQQVTPVQELVQPTFSGHLAEDEEENVPETNFEEQFESPPPSPQLPPPVVQPVVQPAVVVQPVVQPPPRSPSPVVVAAVVSQPSSPVVSPAAVVVAPPVLEEEDHTLQYGGVDSTEHPDFGGTIEVGDEPGGFIPEEKFGGDEVVVTVGAVLPSEELREWQKFAKNGGVGVRMPQVLNQYQSTVWQFGNDE